MNRKTLTFAGALVTSCVLALGVGAPAFAAQTDSPSTPQPSATAGLVIAQDNTATINAVPSAPGSIRVTTAPNTTVTVASATRSGSKSSQPMSKPTNAKGQVTFTGLTPGQTYTVLTSTAATKVTVLGRVGAATNVMVTTTGRPGEVKLTWKHARSAARGEVRYQVEAIPAKKSAARIVDEVRTNSAVLRGLELNTRYTFRVTPVNELGAGTPTAAAMNRTLAEITGSITNSEVELSQEPTEEPLGDPMESAPITPVPTPTPAPAQPSKPSGPSTRTIYVCPDGFGESGGACTQTRAYTFHSETETAGYTFHSESRVESCAGPDCPGSRYVDFGTDWTGAGCPNGGTLHGGACMGWTNSTRTVSVQVKDAAPAGWSDDGTQYTRTAQVKDAAPAGFSDNGSEWVKTTSKVAREVAA